MMSRGLIQSGVLIGGNARAVGTINLTSIIRWWDKKSKKFFVAL
jgi:hypothetical protein